MIAIPDRYTGTLWAVRSVWDAERFVVIGAAAVACHTGLWWRGTIDLDLTVASGIEAYAGDLETLGWRRVGGAPLRWTVPDGSQVDVVPSGKELLSQGELTWPDGDGRMDLIGFRLAHADAVSVDLAGGCDVRVASLGSLVVLKMAAYLDQPWLRDSDLADIAHIMHDYPPDDDEARWSDEIVELGMQFEDVGPFLLGAQIGSLVDRKETQMIERFLSSIDDPDDRLATVHRMARRAPSGWRDPGLLLAGLTAFANGLRGAGGKR
jgi:predicted nucleotidyltransferase